MDQSIVLEKERAPKN